jgi:hypothetical protein
MDKANKPYPTDEEIARVMAERKLNRVGTIQCLRRQSGKAVPIAQPKELNKVLAKLGDNAPHVAAATSSKKPKGEGRKLKYDREHLIQLWEKGLSISQIAEKMSPISKVFVHRTLVTHFPKQYQAGQEARSAARKAAPKEAAK